MINVSDRATIAKAIALMQAAGVVHRIPLLRAAGEGRIAFVELQREGGPPPLERIKELGKPAVILLGDDDDAPTGPEGWRHARQLICWAGAAMVHACAGEPEHYQAAVEGAIATRHMLLVETSGAMAKAWLSLVVEMQPKLPTVVLLPRPGDQHPRPAVEQVRH